MAVESIDFRRAEARDAAGILALNQQWNDAFEEGNKALGFLKNRFTGEQIQGLIEQGDVVVAQREGQVIAYYLINSLYPNAVIQERRDLVVSLVAEGRLPAGRYVYLTQAAVAPAFMGQGVAKRLLALLKAQVRDRFDYLVGYIDTENENAWVAHLRSGWAIFAKVESGSLAWTPTQS